MESKDLKDKLIESLGKIYYMEAFSQLTEFLQGELYVLHFLSENQGIEVNPSMLSDKLYISRPRITAALSALRKKGYVETEMSEDDRRKILVKLTKEGLIFIEDKQKTVEGYFDLFVDGLGEKNTSEIIRLIDLTVQIMEPKDKKH